MNAIQDRVKLADPKHRAVPLRLGLVLANSSRVNFSAPSGKCPQKLPCTTSSCGSGLPPPALAQSCASSTAPSAAGKTMSPADAARPSCRWSWASFLTREATYHPCGIRRLRPCGSDPHSHACRATSVDRVTIIHRSSVDRGSAAWSRTDVVVKQRVGVLVGGWSVRLSYSDTATLCPIPSGSGSPGRFIHPIDREWWWAESMFSRNLCRRFSLFDLCYAQLMAFQGNDSYKQVFKTLDFKYTCIA